ncbi:hypothetical protein L1987_30190 [Smallanthus sonchifolius]|uniref:Uncharacterized protein n=1 Tax=Smallanthus sonchifolius TaxID=185202 RepID=A0ACB9I3F5_9ASTR|nr:hypothetical protein L1987_30190 [Smallanthus sonchifolius]
MVPGSCDPMGRTDRDGEHISRVFGSLGTLSTPVEAGQQKSNRSDRVNTRQTGVNGSFGADQQAAADKLVCCG